MSSRVTSFLGRNGGEKSKDLPTIPKGERGKAPRQSDRQGPDRRIGAGVQGGVFSFRPSQDTVAQKDKTYEDVDRSRLSLCR